MHKLNKNSKLGAFSLAESSVEQASRLMNAQEFRDTQRCFPMVFQQAYSIRALKVRLIWCSCFSSVEQSNLDGKPLFDVYLTL
jgi:hypothetical protein